MATPFNMWFFLPVVVFKSSTMSLGTFAVFLFFINLHKPNLLNEIEWSSAWSSILNFLLMVLLVYTLTKASYKTLTSKFMMALSFSMAIFFSTSSGFLFFLSYEAMLFPIAGLILVVGMEPERIGSSVYMLMYTILASLPFMIAGIFMVKSVNSSFISHILTTKVDLTLGLALILTFLVKLPIWGLHKWLPLAHVFSPLEGSIMLAGIMLKAGAYGAHLISQMMAPRNCILMLLAGIASVGSLMSFFSGVSNPDAKAIIAFSSVMHMAWVVCFILSAGPWAEIGVISLLISHGISSPLLFSMAANLGKTGSRSMYYASNLVFPAMSVMVLALLINAGVPPSLNFISEISAYLSFGCMSMALLFMFFISFIFSGLYSLFIWVSFYNPAAPSSMVFFSSSDLVCSSMCAMLGIFVWF